MRPGSSPRSVYFRGQLDQCAEILGLSDFTPVRFFSRLFMGGRRFYSAKETPNFDSHNSLDIVVPVAADQEYVLAQYNLGIMYTNGKGVTQDDILAHMWFNLAAAQRHENARKNREIVVKRMNRDQLTEAQRMAREWKPK